MRRMCLSLESERFSVSVHVPAIAVHRELPLMIKMDSKGGWDE